MAAKTSDPDSSDPDSWVVEENGVLAEVVSDPEPHDTWFQATVQEALDDKRPLLSHKQVMDEAQALIDKKRRART